MSLKQTVEALTRTAVSTAVTAARHPIGTATRATGLAKDAAGIGIGLVRGQKPESDTAQDVSSTPVEEVPVEAPVEAPVEEAPVEEAPVEQPAVQATTAKKPAATKPAAKKPAAKKQATKKQATPAPVAEDPRDEIPGPDLAAFAPPAPGDLPEPIVIEAE